MNPSFSIRALLLAIWPLIFSASEAADAQIVGEIISLEQEETTSVYIEKCAVTIAMENQSGTAASIDLSYELGLVKGSASSYTYVPDDTFGLSKAYRFPRLAPGERRETNESMLGVSCQDIEQMALQVNCIVPDTAHSPPCSKQVIFRSGVIPHVMVDNVDGSDAVEAEEPSSMSVGPLHANWQLTFPNDTESAVRFAIIQDDGEQAFGDFVTTNYLCRVAGEDPTISVAQCELARVNG